MSYDEGALLEPLAVAVHAIQKAQITSSSSCLILGAGAVGLLCAAAARAQGCTDIVMADIALNRLQFALDNGFASAIAPMKPMPAKSIEEKLANAKDAAGQLLLVPRAVGADAGKFHATFECTGVESCVQAAIYVCVFSSLFL